MLLLLLRVALGLNSVRGCRLQGPFFLKLGRMGEVLVPDEAWAGRQTRQGQDLGARRGKGRIRQGRIQLHSSSWAGIGAVLGPEVGRAGSTSQSHSSPRKKPCGHRTQPHHNRSPHTVATAHNRITTAPPHTVATAHNRTPPHCGHRTQPHHNRTPTTLSRRYSHSTLQPDCSCAIQRGDERVGARGG